MPQRVNVI